MSALRKHHDCDRCAELQERVEWLEAELGIQVQADAERRIIAMLEHCHRYGRPQIAQFMLALYAAKGRVVTKLQLLEAVPSPYGNEDRDAHLLSVLVCRARRSFGHDSIETVFGRGFRMTPTGMAKVAAILGEPTGAP